MEFLYGVVGGFFGTLTSHPFDTIRTRQTKDPRPAAVVTRELLKSQGLRGIYSGVYSPCLSVGIWKGVVLGSHWQLMALQMKYRGVKSEKELALTYVTMSACVAGSLGAMVCSPFEMLKSRAQLESVPGAGSAKEPVIRRELRHLKRIFETRGLAGFTRGAPLLVMRDFHATGVFLGLYEVVLREARDKWGIPASFAAALAGAISGPVGWVSCYPIELLRVHYQGNPKYASYRECARRIWKEQGYRGFFRGLPLCCVRSFFQIGTTMYVFVILQNFDFRAKAGHLAHALRARFPAKDPHVSTGL